MKLALAVLLTVTTCFGAESLSVATVSLAADGVTLTAAITGGACPDGTLSPASGITGFSVSVSPAGWAGSISSATRVECAVTLVVSEPISVDETPTLSLATAGGGSNLNDGAGNTPVGQSGIAVTNGSGWHGVNAASMSGKYQAEGAGGSAANYAFQLNGLSGDWCYRINLAGATHLDVYAYNNHNIWQIRQDGVPIHTYTEDDSNAFSAQGLVTGLSGDHEYAACQNNPQAQNFFYSTLVRIRFDGTLGSQPTVKSIILAGGDSITAYAGVQPLTDSTTGDLYQVAKAMGMADQYWGNPGDELSSMDTQIPAAIAYLSGSIPFMTVAGSTDYNDYSASATATQVGTYMVTLLTGIDALSNPPAHVLVMGNLPFASPIPGTYDTAIAAALAGHSRACFAPRLTWINTTSDRQSDGLHINADGYAKIANQEIPIAAGYINGASFTVSGPSSGLTGAQATFPISLPNGFQWTGSIPVTLTSSNGSDAVCVGASCGTGSVTATPASASTPALTLTPAAVAGERTLTVSGLPACWTAPGTISFTASFPSSGVYLSGVTASGVSAQ